MANFNLTSKNYFSKYFAFIAIALSILSVVPLVNAVPTGVYGFTSLFGDDQVDNNLDSVYARAASRPAFNGVLTATKRISPSITNILENTTIDTRGKYAGTITETEVVNLFGQADFNSVTDKYEVKNAGAWYSMEFNDALPACLDVSYPLANCPTNSRLDRAGVKVNFLGQPYQVTYLTVSPPAPKKVTSITLSKVLIDQVLSVGDISIAYIGNGPRYEVRVDSISAPPNSTSTSLVSLNVRNPAWVSETVTVSAGAAPTKVNGIYVQVPDAFYVQGGTSTARVIVANDSIKLTESAFIDEMRFGKWKTHFVTSNNRASEAISAIQLGNDLESLTLKPNDKLEIIKGNPVYYWQFKGLSLANRDYDMLTIEPAKNFNNIKVKGIVPKCSLVAVQFSSRKTNAFEIGTNGEKRNYAWYVVKDNTRASLGNSPSQCGRVVGKFIYKRQQSGEYDVGASTFNYTYGTLEKVPVSVHFERPDSYGDMYGNISIHEKLSETNAAPEAYWNIILKYYNDERGLTFESNIDHINYVAVLGRNVAEQGRVYLGPAPFYSPRGSKVTIAPTADKFIISYATKLGKASYVLVKNNVVASAKKTVKVPAARK
ncbi:MAG: hypothetical protein V1722_00475 [Candidatus Micrarchaeota archaeon]